MSKEFFKPESLSIKKLFASPDSLFEIPIYQRPYSWEESHIEALWEDLYSAYKNKESNPNYFLGSIITVSNENGYQDIVDGQQRITTLMILFCVIRDMYPKINENTNIDSNPITIRSVKNFIHDMEDQTRLKLRTHDSHQNDFEKYILKEGSLNEYPLTDNDVISKFMDARKIFEEKLRNIGEYKAGQLLNYIGNYVKIVKITCENGSFAIKLFRVLNDRGLELDQSDLIKSFLILKLDKSKHNQFIADWNKISNMIEDFADDEDIEYMFNLYVYYHLASNPEREISKEIETIFETKLENKDSNEMIHDFKDFCSLYGDHISKSNNKVIHCLWYLTWKIHWKAVLTTALKFDFKEYKELAFELRRFYYLNWIAGKTVNSIKQTSFNLIKFIKENKPLSFIKDKLEQKLEYENIFQLALNNLRSNVVKSRWIKPLLMMIEYHMTDGEDKDFVFLSREAHLEHILPVKYQTTSGWGHITEKTADHYLNSIGNLTLLGGRKNVSASNNSFRTKLNVYKGSGTHNESKEGMTSFLITQKIAQDFNAGDIKRWDKFAMAKRWNWFLNELKDLLRLDVSSILIDEENKIDDIKNQDLVSFNRKKESGHSPGYRPNREKNKDFFNQFMNEMDKECPNFYLRHSVDNAIRAVPSKNFSHITVFRAINPHRVGMWWSIRKDEDYRLFEFMKKDQDFPKYFKYSEYELAEDVVDISLVKVKYFDDIYDPSTYKDQMDFLKTNLVEIYHHLHRKILEFNNLNPKAS